MSIPSRKLTLALMIIPVAIVLLGIAMLPFGVRNFHDSFTSKSWPTVEGVIKHSSIGGSGDTFHADILYEYTVDSTDYVGTKISLSDYGLSNPSHARKISNRYPAGETVKVYYKKSDPGNAILEPGLRFTAILLLLFSLIFILVGARAIVILRRDYVKKIGMAGFFKE